MKIQNLVQTITADRAAFTDYDTWKRNNEPFLIDEYFITRKQLDDYEVRVSVLDEDQLPIVTAVVDIYDDIDEAEQILAFVGSISDNFRHHITRKQLVALLDSYNLFVSKATFPEGREDFEDLRLLKMVVGHVSRGGSIEKFFAVPEPHRKRQRTDYSQNRFRETASVIAEKFLAAS